MAIQSPPCVCPSCEGDCCKPIGADSSLALPAPRIEPDVEGVKLLTPGAAFLDQMWLAGLALIALLIAISWMSPEPEKRVAVDKAAQESARAALAGRDLLFDLLCLGVVVLTLALYIIFF